MDSTDSSSCSKQPQLPPGFRFHPTDEELIIHYLKKKASSDPLPLKIITEIDLYKFDPWELPGKASFGDQEWYFFSPRDRKYPNGARPNRASTSGYWKATGTDKPILSSGGTQKVGVKKALVFYRGKPPKGIKTNWIMHEYRLIDSNSSKKPHGSNIANKKNSLRLDDWVLCRIYKKNNSHIPMEIDKEDSIGDILSPLPTTTIKGEQNLQEKKPKAINYGGPLENNNENPFEGLLTDPLNCTSVSPYWNDIRSDTPRSEKTMLQANHNISNGDETNGNNSIANFLNQIPQTSPFHHQILHGSMGDGFFRYPYQIPDMNWNT